MKQLLKKFENKRPQIVFEWKDVMTEAEGWIVINSLRGGAAGGGTRMRKGLDKREVESLAKTMEVKFTVSGPAIGGAKSGINFDPNDGRKQGVLDRWYQAVTPILKNYYGTGGDLNVDEIHEVIPITEKYGLLHPQEGVVNGHFHANEKQKAQKIQNLREGVSLVIKDKELSPDVSRKYVVADMITGYGVSESVRHFYSIYGGELKGKTVIIQGWGNVASAAAFYLAQAGAKIIGISDRTGGLINEAGFTFEEIRHLFVTKKGNQLHAEKMLSAKEMEKRVWDLPAEIFIPAAASRLVTAEQMERLMCNNLEVVACGANVPFADSEIFFGPIAEYADSKVSLIPDFIANCGMAPVFSYLMGEDVMLTDKAIFDDTSTCIHNALRKTFIKNSTKKIITQTAFEIALKQLV
ncbi:MAG: amino acid dehydrogenase [Bacteroidetes bacterium]|nr:amino acid dehydrogenase [Bacteroidota bacterium]